jgi:hypothetical protein
MPQTSIAQNFVSSRKPHLRNEIKKNLYLVNSCTVSFVILQLIFNSVIRATDLLTVNLPHTRVKLKEKFYY